MNTNSFFIKYEDNPSDTLVVAFSHVGYPEGKFAFTRAIVHLQCKKLYINCPDNSWYQDGIPGFGESIEISAINLKKTIDSLQVKKTIFMGMSMGGYAALLFGLLCSSNIVLAFTAELMIGTNRTRSFKENLLRNYHPIYQNLSSLLMQNVKTQIFAIYGEDDLIDLSLLWPISSLIVKAERIKLFFVAGGHQCTLNLNVPLILGVLVRDGWLSSKLIDPVLVRDYDFNISEFFVYSAVERLLSELKYKDILRLLESNEITNQRQNLLKIKSIAAEELRGMV